MPLTYYDIERQTGWRIPVVFMMLVLLYALVIGATVPLFFCLAGSGSLTVRSWLLLGAIALGAAGIHFFFASYDAVSLIRRTLDAQEPDPDDEVHRTLLNIMEEIYLATGSRRRIPCVVLPSLAMNALAAEDLQGNAIVGVTEGLLARLKRPQIEAVVAHEVSHILSGDCLETTVASSLFGPLAEAMERTADPSSGGSFVPHPAFFASWLLLKLGMLVNLFISREREYRADAAAVRLTRDPLSLAETLQLLSTRWRGSGFIGSGLEMICIVNPEPALLDEQNSRRADLLSTHPPIAKRIELLLGMVRVDPKDLAATVSGATPSPEADVPTYYARDPQQAWMGPFTLAELAGLPWLSALTWIATNPGDRQTINRAWHTPALDALLAGRFARGPLSLSGVTCPACGQPLVSEVCEGAPVSACRFCGGTLVDTSRVPRILARAERDRPCSHRINALARTVVSRNQRMQAHRLLRGIGNKQRALLSCPKCNHPMLRGFYSQAHLIEIDRCGACGLTWFEQDELEMLQCLIASRILPGIDQNASAEFAGPARKEDLA